MSLPLTAQFFAGCGFVLVPFAALACVAEATMRAMIPASRGTP